MKNWKPWENLFGETSETDKEDMLNLLNITGENPFPMP